MKIEIKCETCTWWIGGIEMEATKRDTVEMIGVCRRFPPTHVDNVGWGQARIGSDGGCGEWTRAKLEDEGV